MSLNQQFKCCGTGSCQALAGMLRHDTHYINDLSAMEWVRAEHLPAWYNTIRCMTLTQYQCVVTLWHEKA